MNLVAALAEAVAIPVVRHRDRAIAETGSRLLARHGFAAIELTFTIPDVAGLIAQLRADAPDTLVGAGTVLDASAARRAIDAGASFVVSPCYVDEVAAECRSQRVAYIAAGATPGEILHCWRAGAPLVKVFPARQLGGPGFVRAVRAVFPDIPLMPTGGVGLDEVADYRSAGAACVGLGELFPAHALERGDLAAAEVAVEQARRAIRAGS
ncbi:MAG: bifunctional 4-hydroxy-2-oxoglutarate aldolase/2-dehydro-3-deoxy-phosphogluconate aldolase [Burkholderiales bacterium]|nr:MAG: bifunctional 4-hydroxy-2-oxoglutarate aldolase/2-dehydro-3-deoxy-phosphogluconate aldolase [Burkholderiales bacterium]